MARSRRVIVCGGRDFFDATLLRATLDRLHAERPITMLFHGNALGADSMAHTWAAQKYPEVRPVPCPAQWSKYGKRAGPKRNQDMLGQLSATVDTVIAFPGGRGTADMVKRARLGGFEVVEVEHADAGRPVPTLMVGLREAYGADDGSTPGRPPNA